MDKSNHRNFVFSRPKVKTVSMEKYNHRNIVGIRSIVYDISGNMMVFLICQWIFGVILKRDNVSFTNTFLVSVLYTFIYVLLGISKGRYNDSTVNDKNSIFRSVSFCCAVATAMTTFVFYFTARGAGNRGFYALYYGLSMLIHLGLGLFSRKLSKAQSGASKTLLIGSKESFRQALEYIARTSIAYDPVGYMKLVREGTADEQQGHYLGYVSEGDLEWLIRNRVVDQVYIMRERSQPQMVQECLDICVKFGLTTRLFLQREREDCSFYLSRLGSYPVVSYHLNSLDPVMALLKRGVDILGACVGILLFSPILLVAGIAVKLDSEGPVFFTQTRVGQNGRRFQIIKLRTMGVDAEARKKELMDRNEMGGSQIFKIKDDPRVTRVGDFLRKTSIDEIPQFFNVLAGHMSLVGTRPPTVDEVRDYEDHHWRRLRIKPGITGLWQISGRNAISDFDEIVALDTEYIEGWSVFTDFKIMLKTVGVIFKRKGAY